MRNVARLAVSLSFSRFGRLRIREPIVWYSCANTNASSLFSSPPVVRKRVQKLLIELGEVRSHSSANI